LLECEIYADYAVIECGHPIYKIDKLDTKIHDKSSLNRPSFFYIM